jgi:glycosyltransferase involved in cell wall biosynthesis
MAYHLVSGLALSSTCEVLAVLLNDGCVADRFRQSGVRVEILDETVSSFPGLLRGLRNILKTFRPDIIHSHRYKENLLAWLATKVSAKAYLVATQHGMPETYGKRQPNKSKVVSWANFSALSRGFARLVVVSRDMNDALAKAGYDRHKLTVIHNGIELPSAPIIRGTDHSPRTIGSCGRLFPVKNFKLFVELAARVAVDCPAVRFELAGDGPEQEQLRDLCSKRGVEGHFRFLGHVEDMSSFFRRLDVYVSTSHHEGIPMSVLEAMGHGLPVIAPNVGGFPEIIEHGVDGLLIPEHDPELFAIACERLMSDSELLAAMSRAARKKAEIHFSMQRMTEDYIQLYHELIGSSCLPESQVPA